MLTLLVKGLPLAMIPQNLIGGAESFTLLAVPFYILAGEIMNIAGITQRIFNFALALVGHIKGGLGHVKMYWPVWFLPVSQVPPVQMLPV